MHFPAGKRERLSVEAREPSQTSPIRVHQPDLRASRRAREKGDLMPVGRWPWIPAIARSSGGQRTGTRQAGRREGCVEAEKAR